MGNCSAVYCHNNKTSNKDKTFFTLPGDVALAKVWIAKLNLRKTTFQKCFDLYWSVLRWFFWLIFDATVFINLSRETHPASPALRVSSNKIFPQIKVKQRNASKKREENRRHEEVCSVFRFQKSYTDDNLCL